MITQPQAVAEIDKTLKNLGFSEVGPGFLDYRGPISVHGKTVEIIISIPDVRFVDLPTVSLRDRGQVEIKVLAHIEANDQICYRSAIGLPLDMYAPAASVLRVLEEARRTLESSARGRAIADIVNEFQAYWKASGSVRSMVIGNNSSRLLRGDYVTVSSLGADSFAAVTEHGAKIPGWKVTGSARSLIVNATQDLEPLPGRPYHPPETLAEAEIWVKHQPGLRHVPWSKVFECLASEEPVCFLAENASVGLKVVVPQYILHGVKRRTIRAHKVPNMLAIKKQEVEVKRLSIVKADIKSVVNRGNRSMTNLSGVKVALIGCGTIGGYLARMLAQSGAGTDPNFPMTIFDDDSLAVGNIGRHMLGFADIGKSKALATAEELRRFHPQCNVLGVHANAFAKWNKIKENDLVIDATGDWNVQNATNERFMGDERGRIKAILHCWVVMNGAAAQSFLNLGDQFACFRCLKPVFNQPWRYPAFNAENDLNVHPASCTDGAFVPFSVDASVMAASLANKAALDWVGETSGKRLRTVEVDETRGRYQKPVSPTPAPSCPCCGGVRT